MIEDNDKELLERFKTETSESYSLSEDQRDASNEDMRFCNIDGGMWEGWLESTHSQDRARLELDLVSDFVNRYVGEFKDNPMMPLFEAADLDTSEDDAEILNGVHRADFRDNDGKISIDNAVEEVAECGVGAFQFITKFEDEGDPENENQDIHYAPVHNAYSTIVWDQNAKRIDKADSRWCTKLTSYTPKAYEIAFPDEDPISAYDPTSRQFLNWVTPELVWVAERYEMKKEKVKVSVYRNIEQEKTEAYRSDEVDEIKEQLEIDGWEFVRERELTRQVIYKSIFNGSNFIGEKEKRIPGEWIPIIPMYGVRKFIDGVEYYRGLVRKAKDAARLINASVSRFAEGAASSGDSIPIFTDEEIEGKKDLWADKTNKAFMLKNSVIDANGNSVKLPTEYLQSNQVDPNSMQGIEIANNFLQRLTSSMQEDSFNPDSSGKALQEVRKKENLNTKTMTDNIITSIAHAAKVYRSIAGEVYTNFRSKRSESEDGTTKIIKLNDQVMDQESGTMKPVNDLSKGKFAVTVKVGPQYNTEREATLDSLERIMDKVGQENKYFAPMLSMWINNIQGTGLKPLKDFNRKDMILSGMIAPETEEEEAMVQQAGQQTDPQAELTKAAATQQLAEAKNLEASRVQKLEDARKKKAETLKITTEIGQQQRMRFNPTTGELESAGSRNR